MIPLKLNVRNFLCYRDDVPPLDLAGIHVACLCGPNGHGKSALLDAVTWCLWGQARTGSRNHNSLIAYGETECRVELDFQAKGQMYRAIRRRRSAGQGRTELDLFVLDDADQARPITGNTLNETGARIRNLLGMDYDTFVNSAFLLQGRSDEFTRKTPSERKDVLSAILGLELYENLQSAARGKRSEWQDTATRTEGALAQTRSALDSLADPTDELAGVNLRLDNLATELNAATIEAQQRRDALADLRRRQADVETRQRSINELRETIRREEANLTAMQDRIRSAHALAERADEIAAGVRLLDQARTELDRLESARREHAKLQERRSRLQIALDRAEAALASDIASLERRISQDLEPVATQAERIGAQLLELVEAENALNAQQAAVERQAEEVAVLSAEMAARSNRLERCVAEGTELRAKQRELSGAAGPDALCPLCRTPLSEDACENIAGWYASEIAAKLQQHAELTEQLRDLTQRRDRLSASTDDQRTRLTRGQREAQQQRGRVEQERKQSDEARRLMADLQPRLTTMRNAWAAGEFAPSERAELAALDHAIHTLGYDDAARAAAYESAQSLQPWDAEKSALDAALERLPHDEAELSLAGNRVGRLVADLADAEAVLASDQTALTALPELEQATEHAETVLSGLSAERDDLLARRGRLQADADRRSALREEISRLEDNHKTAQAEQGIYSDLFGAFGRSGVPAMLIDAAVPHLENEANDLLGRMTDNRMAIRLETQRDNRSGNTTETLDILISDELGSRNYELFSGGEAFRINLALRIALSKVLSQRLGAPLPTLFIDEGFGTQDAAGRERIVDAIASIQDQFEKIIVITHLDDLKDLFPARIEVLKTETGSQFWLS